MEIHLDFSLYVAANSVVTLRVELANNTAGENGARAPVVNQP